MNDNSRRNKWNSLLRISGFLAALGGMYISAKFSVDGFQFSTDNPQWVGWMIAGIIIVLESVWQKFGRNRTLFAIALVCYTYGIITNVVGIAQAKGGYANMDFMDWLVATVFGALFEIFPEPVLAWSISGDTSSDPLGKFIDGLSDEKPEPKHNQQNNQNKKHINYIAPKSQYKAQHRPQHLVKPTFQDSGKFPPFDVPQWMRNGEGE